jgi:hypothetical protein
MSMVFPQDLSAPLSYLGDRITPMSYLSFDRDKLVLPLRSLTVARANYQAIGFSAI